MLSSKIELFNKTYDSLDLSPLNYPLSVTPVSLLRLIVNEFKNNAINISSKIKKKRCIELKTLESQLTAERQLTPPNQELINNLSAQIESLVEVESNILCRHRCSSNSANFEKDPAVLGSIAKTKSNVCTDVVKIPTDEGFIDFESNDERNKYIYDFYKKLYNNQFQPTLSFDEFLHKENSAPIPPRQKLDGDDIYILSSQISFKELSDAIFACKNKTSVGLDLISNQLLQNTFPIISPFLLNAFNSVFNHKEDFPVEFKTSYIRLIPKSNSNLSNIKSWRPISIGSAIYKL